MRCAGRAFTMTELVAVLVVVALLLVVLVAFVVLPIISGQSRGPHPRINALRGIHQAMVMYGQGNNEYYPGLNSQGERVAIDVEQRLKLLMQDDFFSPDYLVSPAERQMEAWEAGPFTSEHYSYAMLQVPASGGRHAEWRETMNTRAAVIADRNTGTADDPSSIHHRDSWRGYVLWNDNHVGFETTHVHDTNYGGVDNTADHLFRAAGDDDAYMIHSGN